MYSNFVFLSQVVSQVDIINARELFQLLGKVESLLFGGVVMAFEKCVVFGVQFALRILL
jgi:hypothetical protein